MAITPEQAQEIKEQLLKQLDNFPEDKRIQIKEQINAMTTEQVEKFIEQNKLTHLGNQCIFCSIVAGKTPSYKLAEDTNNIAILELNPLSQGHTLIVPKDHSSEIKSSTKILAEKIGERIKTKFGPKDIQINELEIMEHKLLEVIPLYGNENERYSASEHELITTQEEFQKPSEETKTGNLSTQETKKETLYKMKPRIP